MTTLMVTHQVVDRSAWQQAFEAGAALRAQHGATSARVLLDGDGVVGLIDFPDDAAAHAFLADPALRKPIPGVNAAPTLRLLHDVESGS